MANPELDFHLALGMLVAMLIEARLLLGMLVCIFILLVKVHLKDSTKLIKNYEIHCNHKKARINIELSNYLHFSEMQLIASTHWLVWD